MEATSTVGIVLVNYHAFGELALCLDSLREVHYPDFFVVVVDNDASGDELKLAEAYPEIEVLPQALNLGFPGGCNVGISHALSRGAEHVLLLNIDTVVPPDFLDHLVGALVPDDVGVVGGMMVDYQSATVVEFAGATLDYKGRCFATQTGQLAAEVAVRSPFAVEYLHGSAMMIKREVLALVGLFDDRYFLNYEDIDYCARVAGAGYQLVMVPAASYRHRANVTIAKPMGHYYLVRNRLLFLADHRRWRQLAPALLAAFLHSRRDGDRDGRAVGRRALSDFRHGRFGRRPIGLEAMAELDAPIIAPHGGVR